MWLINTSTFQLTEFHGQSNKPPYAILSHRWNNPSNEVSFKEYRKGLKTDTSGYWKIKRFCRLANNDGFKWAWVDTCCIDKRSSAELTESINSMYSWYEDAEVCYAYLGDVTSVNWRSSKWWNRGWTLQELIAPQRLVFFDRGWSKISNRKSMADDIEKATKIPAALLKKEKLPNAWTVAQRMAWAADRITTRIEDRAYSLLGLFKINMPMLYGEGINAFQRLQIEILQKYPDESILAWQQKATPGVSVLASSPEDFRSCLDMHPSGGYSIDQDPDPRREHPPRVTSWGIELRANARKLHPFTPVYIKQRRQRFLWAITLITALQGHLQELPYTMVLVHCGPTPYTYSCYECHHGDSAAVFRNLRDRYEVDDIEPDRLFYLDIT